MPEIPLISNTNVDMPTESENLKKSNLCLFVENEIKNFDFTIKCATSVRFSSLNIVGQNATKTTNS